MAWSLHNDTARDRYNYLAIPGLLTASKTLGIAGEIQSNDSGTIWQAGIDGVEIEWGPDGSFSRIYSRFSQPVEVGDRRGILKSFYDCRGKSEGCDH